MQYSFKYEEKKIERERERELERKIWHDYEFFGRSVNAAMREREREGRETGVT